MKVLIRLADHVAIFADHAIELTEIAARGNGWHSNEFTTGNARIEEADLPAHWCGGAFRLLNGVWSIHDQAVYDARREAEAARQAADARAAIPPVVSKAQGKAALIAAGLWPSVLAYVDAIADPTDKALAEVALNDTQEWRRDSLFLNSAATALGLTAAQLDQLFVDASGIVF